MTMSTEVIAIVLLCALSLGVLALPPWRDYSRRPGYLPIRYPNDPREYGRPPCRYGWNCDQRPTTGEDGRQQEEEVIGCSCLLYLEYALVFSRVDNGSQRYPCNRRGLQMCNRYCDDLFNDEGIRTSSREEACDYLRRDVDDPWYRKDQVCGSSGPYRDSPLAINLCCRQGLTSSDCDS